MNIDDAITLFSKSFPSIPNEVILELINEGKFIDIKKKEYFSQTGNIDERVGLVFKGIFRGYYLKEEEKISTWFSSESDIIASYMGLLSKAPSKLSYQALEDSTVFTLDYNKIREKAASNLAVMNFLLEILEKQLLESYQRIERYILRSPEERFKNLLENKPEIFNRVSQRMLASYVGVTPVSFSRIKARLTPRRKA